MIIDDKKSLRRTIRAKIAMLSSEEKRVASEQLCRQIAELEEVRQGGVIALFIALDDEPSLASLIEQLATKRTLAPRIEGEEMEFYDISEGLERGAFGILEPTATTPVEPSEIDVMVVPGVAFTPNGARCGRGKGFYDKYLSREGFRAHTIGVCYPCQVVDELPTDKYDKMVEKVVQIEN